jgi:hypothetical protein
VGFLERSISWGGERERDSQLGDRGVGGILTAQIGRDVAQERGSGMRLRHGVLVRMEKNREEKRDRVDS